MAKSFGWQNGIKHDDHMNDEIARGWRLTISPAGWNEMVKEFPSSAFRLIEIQRGFEGEDMVQDKHRWLEEWTA